MESKQLYTANELSNAFVKGDNLPDLKTHDLVVFDPSNPSESITLYGWDEIGLYDNEFFVALYQFIKH
jgi:hypothetical protein